MRPPTLARAILIRLTPADLSESLLDDLDEAYARIRARHGTRRARWWYRRQALFGIWSLARLRLDRRRQSRAHSGRARAGITALRHARRRLVATPGLSASVILTLGFAFAANLTIFALVHGVLLRPLPYPDPGRLVDVGHRTPGIGVPRAGQSQGAWFVHRRESRSFEAIGIYNENVVNLTDVGQDAEQVPIAMISHDVLVALGTSPLIGRFTPADDGPDTPPTVLLAHDLWKRRYNGDRAIVGRTVEINGSARRVLGIMPEGFAFPSPETGIWMRQGFDPADVRFGELIYGSVARLRAGVTAAQAEAELNGLLPGMVGAYADLRPDWVRESRLAARVEPLHQVVTGDVQSALWLVFGAAALVLGLSTANVANLFLIRAERRRLEVGICRALGAAPSHVLLGFLAEALIACVVATVLALGLGRAALRYLVMSASPFVPRLESVAIDGVAVAYVVCVAIVTAGILGLAAFWRARHATLSGTTRGASSSRREARTRDALSAVQVALAFAVICAAALLVRSFWNLTHVDLGFQADRVLTFETSLPTSRYRGFSDAAGFYRDLLARLRAHPDVEAAGAVTDLPLSGHTIKLYLDSLVFVERDGGDALEAHGVNWKLATPGYLDTMGVPVLRGRWFEPGDHFDASSPLVVSHSFARRYLGDQPIGRRLRHYADPHAFTIVGVVGDIRDEALRGGPAAAIYVPVLDQTRGAPFVPRTMSVAVRLRHGTVDGGAIVRDRMRELDGRIAVANLRTMTDIVERALARDRLVLTLVGAAATLAILVGLVGLYGAMGCTIAQRRRELGIRLALGATTRRLAAALGRRTLVTVTTGLAAGTGVAWLLTASLSSVLFDVAPRDPTMWSLAALGLTAMAVATTGISLRRLRAISPVEAMRVE
jgi:predicted permease